MIGLWDKLKLKSVPSKAKIRWSTTDPKVVTISKQIADAFYEYKYNEADLGLVKYIKSREDMFTYMNAIIQAAYNSGLLFTTSDRQEGYLMLSGEGAGAVRFFDGIKMIMAEKKTLGGFSNMKKFIKACFAEGIPVILDTDDKDKAARYEHLGMKLDRVRNCGERFHMYDLIKE